MESSCSKNDASVEPLVGFRLMVRILAAIAHTLIRWVVPSLVLDSHFSPVFVV